jgi:hypothetical protein
MYCDPASGYLDYPAMATSGAVITRISEAAGVAPATVDRMLRPLRAAGLAPKGRPGRGQTEGTYLPFHIMCLTLGFAGAQPSDAAEAAEMLRRFEWYLSLRSPEGEPLVAPQLVGAPRIPGTLGEVLQAIIAGGFGLLQEKPNTVYNWYTPSLTLSLMPPEATVTWPDGQGGYGIVEKYGPPKDAVHNFKNRGIERQTLIKSTMIDAAISLWQDTPKTENAGSLAGEPASQTAAQRRADQQSLNISELSAG